MAKKTPKVKYWSQPRPKKDSDGTKELYLSSRIKRSNSDGSKRSKSKESEQRLLESQKTDRPYSCSIDF